MGVKMILSYPAYYNDDFFYSVSLDSARREVLLYNNIKYYYVLTTKMVLISVFYLIIEYICSKLLPLAMFTVLFYYF
jgi:hypothetical protein